MLINNARKTIIVKIIIKRKKKVHFTDIICFTITFTDISHFTPKFTDIIWEQSKSELGQKKKHKAFL